MVTGAGPVHSLCSRSSWCCPAYPPLGTGVLALASPGSACSWPCSFLRPRVSNRGLEVTCANTPREDGDQQKECILRGVAFAHRSPGWLVSYLSLLTTTGRLPRDAIRALVIENGAVRPSRPVRIHTGSRGCRPSPGTGGPGAGAGRHVPRVYKSSIKSPNRYIKIFPTLLP